MAERKQWDFDAWGGYENIELDYFCIQGIGETEDRLREHISEQKILDIHDRNGFYGFQLEAAKIIKEHER